MKYTEGICQDGAAILENGNRMTISEILETLNKNETVCINCGQYFDIDDECPSGCVQKQDLTSKETIDTIGNCANCGVEFHIHKKVFEKDELLSNIIKDCIEKVNTEVPFGKEDAYDIIVGYLEKIQ